jgi:hypothetical protein
MAASTNLATIGANTPHVDFADTLREAIKSAMAGVTSGYSGVSLGAINWAAPNAYDRTVTQWNGVSFVGFKVVSSGGFKSDTYDFAQANASIQASSANISHNFDTGDALIYQKATNTLEFFVGGLYRWAVSDSSFLINTNFLRHVGLDDRYSTFEKQNGPVDGKIWKTVVNDSGQLSFIVNDADSVAHFHDEIFRSGLSITKRHLLRQSGRLLVGNGVVDDGVTGLQATSIRASQQPFASFKEFIPSFPQTGRLFFSAASGSSVGGFTAAGSTITVDRACTVMVFTEIDEGTGNGNGYGYGFRKNGVAIKSLNNQSATGKSTWIGPVLLKLNALDQIDMIANAGPGASSVAGTAALTVQMLF